MIFADLSPAEKAAAAVNAVRVGLETRSAWWFALVQFAGYAVALGCAMEIPETFLILRRWFKVRFRDLELEETIEDKKSWIVPLAAVGLIFIVVGIVVETFAEAKVSSIEGSIRTFESTQITTAEKDAASAVKGAGTAKDSAIVAGTAAANARFQAEQAGKQSEHAGNLANAARQQADGFAKSIEAAKLQAADAVSRLADAVARLAEATRKEAAAEASLAAIKTPRTLIKAPELIAALKMYKGSEYQVTVFEDEEATGLAQSIVAALDSAGWVRKQPEQNFYTPGITMDFGKGFEMVPQCIETGVSVHTQTKIQIRKLMDTQPQIAAGSILCCDPALLPTTYPHCSRR